MKDASLKASPSFKGVIIDKKLFQRTVRSKTKAAGKNLLAELMNNSDVKWGRTILLIDKLFELVMGRLHKGVKNYLNRRYYSKGVKFSTRCCKNMDYLADQPEQMDDR